MNKIKQINIGIIGVGGMGARHADNLQRRVVGQKRLCGGSKALLL